MKKIPMFLLMIAPYAFVKIFFDWGPSAALLLTYPSILLLNMVYPYTFEAELLREKAIILGYVSEAVEYSPLSVGFPFCAFRYGPGHSRDSFFVSA